MEFANNNNMSSSGVSVVALIEKYKKDYPKGAPFVVACETGNLEDVKLFLANNPEVLNQVGKDREGKERTGLIAAADKGHNEVVKLLLDKGADPNIANTWGLTPLDVAKNDEIKELLIDHGKWIIITWFFINIINV